MVWGRYVGISTFSTFSTFGDGGGGDDVVGVVGIGGWGRFGGGGGEVVGVALSKTAGLVTYRGDRSRRRRTGLPMASTAKVDQAARAKARARRIALDTDRAARDARVEDAAAAVFTALESKVQAERDAAAAEERIAHGLRRLVQEGMTTVQAAQLCDLPTSAAQRLLRTHPPCEPSGRVAIKAATMSGRGAGNGERPGEHASEHTGSRNVRRDGGIDE